MRGISYEPLTGAELKRILFSQGRAPVLGYIALSGQRLYRNGKVDSPYRALLKTGTVFVGACPYARVFNPVGVVLLNRPMYHRGEPLC